jgi:AcrR family transcriptional regulator
MARDDVRGNLIRAAERLFAERGSEVVSLREILAAAGATNASAVQYHFNDRAGLLRAVLAKHHPMVEQRRHRLLDDYDAAGVDDIRALAAALVEPLAAELDNPDGGVGYLQLLADVYNRPRPVIDPATIEDPTNSTYRWRAAVRPLLSDEAARLHRRFDASRFAVSELARRGKVRSKRSNRLFTSQLVDLVSALLSAPVSPQTSDLLHRD